MTAARLVAAAVGVLVIVAGPGAAFADETATPEPSATGQHQGLPNRAAPLVQDITPTPAVATTPPTATPKPKPTKARPTAIRPTIGTVVVLNKPAPKDSAWGCICVAKDLPATHAVHHTPHSTGELPFTGVPTVPLTGTAAALITAGCLLVRISRRKSVQA